MQAKKTLANLMLAFVLVSIGFAIGKETAGNSPSVADAADPAGEDRVIVYYLRSTFRCFQCNMIEHMAGELIRSEFAVHLEDGRLEWRIEDYLKNAELARRYQVSGNIIVLSRRIDGKEVGHRRLDRVMEMVLGDRVAFESYLRDAILGMLGDAP